MKLHWSPRSPFVRKVMVCAHELGLAQRIEKVRSTVAMSKPNPEVMKDNPLGKLPTLVLENGSALYDSAVICEYLDGLAGKKLFPKTGPARWQALRWHALGDGMLDLLILWRNQRDQPVERQVREWLSGFALKTENTLQVIEEELPDLQKKGTFGIGQIAIGCALGYIDFRFPDMDWKKKHPALGAWFEEISRRPSMQQTSPSQD
jgi:glutathione S-transferase